MEWKGRRQSDNIEDRRGQRATRSRRGGGLLGGGMKLSLPMLLIGGVVCYFLGINPMQLLGLAGNLGGGGGGGGASAGLAPGQGGGGGGGGGASDEEGQFMATMLGSTEDVFGRIFQERGARYQQPTLVLFTDAVNSACGYNSAAVGPFYCPADQKLYIDLSFFRQLAQMGGPGDFAQAYVVAHEVGHHIQTITGLSQRVGQAKRRVSEVERNQLSVRQELQADCYAGVWGNHARDMLQQGDVEEGLAAAAAIGDDTLQRRAGGRVQPEGWTHGSSEQRVQWFRKGLQSGRIEDCDTFQGTGIRAL